GRGDRDRPVPGGDEVLALLALEDDRLRRAGEAQPHRPVGRRLGGAVVRGGALVRRGGGAHGARGALRGDGRCGEQFGEELLVPPGDRLGGVPPGALQGRGG